MKKLTHLVSFLVLVMFLSACQTNFVPGQEPVPQIVGGPCDYDSYQGTCKVRAYNQETATETGTPLSFIFVTTETVKSDWFTLDPEKVNTVNIKPTCEYLPTVGEELPCQLDVINKGTCTPTIYKISGGLESCTE